MSRSAPLYGYRGVEKTLLLRPGESIDLSFDEKDLAQTSMCCHRPFVSVHDPAIGEDRPAFEVLTGRSSAARRGTDRFALRAPRMTTLPMLSPVRDSERSPRSIDGCAMTMPPGNARVMKRAGETREPGVRVLEGDALFEAARERAG